MVRPELLDSFRNADAEYQRALAEAERLKRVRDDAVLSLSKEGVTVRAIAAMTGLSSARIDQIIKRARRADRAGT